MQPPYYRNENRCSINPTRVGKYYLCLALILIITFAHPARASVLADTISK